MEIEIDVGYARTSSKDVLEPNDIERIDMIKKQLGSVCLKCCGKEITNLEIQTYGATSTHKSCKTNEVYIDPTGVTHIVVDNVENKGLTKRKRRCRELRINLINFLAGKNYGSRLIEKVNLRRERRVKGDFERYFDDVVMDFDPKTLK
ncbi:MAG: hypothetical protein WCK31_02170 [bacterium]